MIDQLMLYDQAMLTWLTDSIITALPERSMQLLIAVPMKGFSEVTSGRQVDARTLTLPRISVTRLDPLSRDPSRFNATRIRRLGWCHNDGTHRAIRSGKFPTPINIVYQLDIWTKFVREMNVLLQQIVDQLYMGYSYLKIRPDEVWQDKIYPIMFNDDIRDNSDLEPGEGERVIRKTMTLTAECWLFDWATVGVNVVKRLELQYRDTTGGGDVLLETDFLPPYVTLGTGDGSTTDFGPYTLTRTPILEHTPVFQTVITGVTEIAHDDGNGLIIGPNTSGSIDYDTGEVTLSYSTAPDNGQDITVTYFMEIV